MSNEAPARIEPVEVPYREHVGASRQYWRDIILGVNDGLVSMFLLVAGIVGGGLSAAQVLIAGVAGSLAGAISMAAGEYMATKSQLEVFDREMALEVEHLEYHRDHERQELVEMFTDMGLEAKDVEYVVNAFDKSDEAMMKVMMALEFGVVDSEQRSPYLAAVLSGLLFLAGSLPAVVPFIFTDSTTTGLLWAAIAASIGLFAVGAFKTRVTGTNPVRAGAENLAVALLGAAASYGVGSLIERAL